MSFVSESRTILVGTDGSRSADEAVDCAVEPQFGVSGANLCARP
jgi:hypothetical protein